MADSTQEATDKKPIGWLPLESNPEVLNPFLWKLGVPGEWGFCEWDAIFRKCWEYFAATGRFALFWCESIEGFCNYAYLILR